MLKRLLLILFVYLISVQVVQAGDEWFRLYQQGIKAMKNGDYSAAVEKFEAALRQRPVDKRKVRTYGMHFIQYFPNRELGITHYFLGNIPEARRYLEISLKQTPTARAKEFLNRTSSQDGPPKPVQRKPSVQEKVAIPAATATAPISQSKQPIKLVGERMSVAVLPFVNNSSNSGLGDIILDKMITSLFNKGRFKVIERTQLEKVLNEQKLGASGLIDASTAAEFGRGLGVDAIIVGSVASAGAGALSIDARAIDTETAAIIIAHDAYSGNTTVKSVKETVDFLVDKFVTSLPLLEGTVIRIDAGGIMVDKGRSTGIKKGVKCTIYREGAEIKHPVTGEVLGKETVIIGEIQITDPFDKYSSGRIIKLEPGQSIAVSDKFITK
ncbi:MAG TPA: hypothetical protein EYP36_09625 [Calditrichaeota bacterium]|nr:hypothetical protein [Calditrichota bacterium]